MRYRVGLVVGAMFAFVSIAFAVPNCAVARCVYLPVAAGGSGAPAVPTNTPLGATSTPTQIPTRTPTLTPTSTATPTLTPVPVTLLPNGDFENGTASWPSGVNVVVTAPAFPVTPHSGASVAQLIAPQVGLQAELDSANVIVPASTPYLTYWVWIRSTEPNCGDDRGAVGISPTTIDKFNLCAATQTSGWVNRSLDLTAFVGQTVNVILIADTFDNDVSDSTLYIDDVGWRATP